MNMIHKMFFNKKKDILNIYFTAGYPILESTNKIIKILQRYYIDIIEVGIPYSDALADGSTIQNSSINSIINGMNLDKLFAQLQCIKKELYIPIIFMGYYNSFLRFGEELFLRKCNQIGISGLIYPDIPDYNYIDNYKKLFKKYELLFIMLITTHTPIERIFYLSSISEGFLYLVSSTSTTGKKFFFEKKKDDFFTCLKIKLNIPKLIGFGISNKKMFNWSCFYSEGAIIGSSFIKSIDKDKYDLEESIKYFIQSIKGNIQE